MISIVDYGMGNLGAIANMLRYVGVASEIVRSPDQLERAERIILPGVGAFDAAMEKIASSGFREVLDRKALSERVPILGICLGMQLLTRRSEEGQLPGLSWIEADTISFRSRIESRMKVPHMGWNIVEPTRDGNGLLRGFEPGQELRFYFVHSYYVVCDNDDDSLLKTEYGTRFDSGVARGNIYGLQFHPEKSHRFGMNVLKNFAEL